MGGTLGSGGIVGWRGGGGECGWEKMCVEQGLIGVGYIWNGRDCGGKAASKNDWSKSNSLLSVVWTVDTWLCYMTECNECVNWKSTKPFRVYLRLWKVSYLSNLNNDKSPVSIYMLLINVCLQQLLNEDHGNTSDTSKQQHNKLLQRLLGEEHEATRAAADTPVVRPNFFLTSIISVETLFFFPSRKLYFW